MGVFVALVFLLGLGMGAGYYGKKYKDLREDYRIKKQRLKERELRLAVLEEKIVIGSLRSSPDTPAIDGRVIMFGDNLNDVIISVGTDDGVKKGYKFIIYRKDK